jgi:hypothetical protein
LFSKCKVRGRGTWSSLKPLIASPLGYWSAVGCITGVGFAVMVAMFVSSPTNDVSHPSAVLYIADPVVELGELAPGEARQVVYRIANRGDRRLIINEIDRGCGCGDPVRRTWLIPPAATRDVAISIDARHQSGAIEKTTSFTSNDPAQPRFDLLINASVDPVRDVTGFDADPRQDFSILIPQQRHTEQ